MGFQRGFENEWWVLWRDNEREINWRMFLWEFPIRNYQETNVYPLLSQSSLSAEYLRILSGTLKFCVGQTGSGKPHTVERCTTCSVAIRSFYRGHKNFCLVKGGTLDDPSAIEPNLHLFAGNKVPWIEITDGVRVFEWDYDAKEVWPVESFGRLMRAIG